MGWKLAEPERINRYVHNCIDRSLTQAFLRRWVTDPVHRFVPQGIDPDLITLIGFAGIVASSATLLLLPAAVRLDPQASRWVMGAVAVLLFVYAVTDQLDGLQAVRQQRSSPRGDFVDHWCDSLAAVLLIGSFGWWFALPAGSVLVIELAAILCFWLNNRDAHFNGQRLLPGLGGLEAVEIGIGLMIAGAIGGIDFVLGAEVPLLDGPTIALALAVLGATLVGGAESHLSRAVARIVTAVAAVAVVVQAEWTLRFIGNSLVPDGGDRP